MEATVSRNDQNFSRLDHTMGHIRGKITDMNGKEIQGSRVFIRETGHTTYSDKYGNFVLINIPPALYTLAIEHEEFSLSVTLDFPVLLGDNPGHIFVLFSSAVPAKLRTVDFTDELVLQR